MARTSSLDGGAVQPAGFDDVEVAGLTANSRDVRPGYLFAALPGTRASGADFIDEALGRGAVAVLAPPGARLESVGSLPLIEDAAPRRRFAHMAAIFYGAQPDIVVAVTGTSGKSSTVSFVRQIWSMLGHEAASLGTLGIESGPITRYGSLTTADPVPLHADLAALAHAGVTHAAMEASSHGLDQHRLDGVRLRAAGFTSFGRDHLDYHVTPEAYLGAKLRLFTEVLPVGGMSVLNADIPEYENLANAIAAAGRRVASYGVRGRDLQITRRSPSPAGQAVTLRMAGRSWDFALPLVGAFQLMNALCAVGLVIAGETDEMTPGGDLGRFVDALRRLTGVRGRLEHIATLQNGAAIYVDYAHKPDALDAILQALRPHAEGQLVVIFGCGGDRDPGKRPLMGDIAARLADHVIVTDDNPRSEDPAAIRAAILAASPGAVEIGEREEAIAAGVRMLQPGDVLVIAGKGHEQGQIVRDTVRPFDDAEVARRIVKDIGA